MATPRDPFWNFLGRGSTHWEKSEEAKGIRHSQWASEERKKQKAEDRKLREATRIAKRRAAAKRKAERQAKKKKGD